MFEKNACRFLGPEKPAKENGKFDLCMYVSIGSMCDICTYIWLILMVNVGKYTMHGSYRYRLTKSVPNRIVTKKRKLLQKISVKNTIPIN